MCTHCCIHNQCRDEQYCKKIYSKNNYNSYIVFLGLFLVFFLSLSIYIRIWAKGAVKVLVFKKQRIDTQRMSTSSTNFSQNKSLLSQALSDDEEEEENRMSYGNHYASVNFKEVES